MKSTRRKITSLWLSFCMILSILCPQVSWAQETVGMQINEQPQVVVDIEKFSLGQGFIMEPVQVPYEEGMTAQDAIKKAVDKYNASLEETNGVAKLMATSNRAVTNEATSSSVLSLVNEEEVTTSANLRVAARQVAPLASVQKKPITIKGLDTGYIKSVSDEKKKANVPSIIQEVLDEMYEEYEMDEFGFIDTRKSPVDELKEGDYNMMSGWTYTVDHHAPSVNIDKQELEAGQVVRVRYTICWGADVGNAEMDKMMESSGIGYVYTEADKLNLLRQMAKINDESALKTDDTLSGLYTKAVETVSQLDVKQTKVDEVSNDIESRIAELQPSEAPSELPALDQNEFITVKNSVISYMNQSADFTKAYQDNTSIDWKAFTLARDGKTVPKSYGEQIRKYVSEYETTQALENALGSITSVERMVIGLTAAGYDASSVVGHNLVASIYNNPKFKEDGINTYIYGLLALDTKPYNVPSDAINSRDHIVSWITQSQLADGSFCYAPEWGSDIDLTAMAIQALAPYYSRTDVKTSVDKALAWLSQIQLANGGYESWGSESSESLSQVICALVSLGKNPEEETDFIKSNGTLMTHLLTFYDKENGGFKHSAEGTVDFNYATPQAAYALVAYGRLLEGKSFLYNMSDVSVWEVLQKETTLSDKLNLALEKVNQYIYSNTSFEKAYGSGDARDWNVLVLARGGREIPEIYGKSIGEYVFPYNKEQLESQISRVTEYERMTIGLTAAGYDASNVVGHNLVEHIYNHAKLEGQGINALIYGLIALDTKPYDVPEDANYTREKITQLLVSSQLTDGSFSYSPKGSGDVDLTAMAIQALAPYKSQANVANSINKALSWLSECQLPSGGYESWGADCSESVAQVICALTSVGKDPAKEAAFIKAEGNLLTRLLTFYDETTGGFKHTEESKPSITSTQQAGYALVSYKRFLENKSSLYNMSDIKDFKPIEKIKYYNAADIKEPIILDKDKLNETIVINQEKEEDKASINIEQCKDALPAIHTKSNTFEMLISKGTGLKTADTKVINIPVSIKDNKENENISAEIQKLLANQNVTKIISHIQVGSPDKSIQFNRKVRLIFKKAAGNHAAFKDYTGKVCAITKLKADADKSKYNEVCYDLEGDLIIETNHLTEFIIYQAKENSGSENSDRPSPKVNVIIERKTLGLSDLFNGTVDYQNGDTVYDVLVRTGFNIEGSSSYVSGIEGLREKQHGTGSGWMISVNGTFINCSVGEYRLNPNDTVRWQYTTNLGKDIGASFVVQGDKENKTNAMAPNVALENLQKELKSNTELSEWQVFGLARSGEQLASTYKQSLMSKVKNNSGDFRKITDLEKTILVLGSLGEDCRDIEGYNLIEKLYNSDEIGKQGNNGVIFALIALDSRQYEIPVDAKWTREKIKQEIIKAQNSGGGFPLITGDSSDVDITAMALQALAPYKEEKEIKPVIEKALKYLQNIQNANGHFSAYGQENSESLSQVIIALTSLGIDPATDTRFIKEGKSLLDLLMEYQVEGKSFAHTKSGGANSMATEQALMALVSYQNFKAGKPSLYTLSKVEVKAVENKETDITKPSTESKQIVDLSKYQDADQISSWAKEEFTQAIAEGIISGYGDTIKPKQEVSRAEFTSMLIRILNDLQVGESENKFKDVESSAWYAEDVLKAYSNGLVNGVSAETFEPMTQISREQVAVILARVLNTETTESAISFKDENTVSPWARNAIKEIAAQEVFKGYEDGTFKPKQKVSREVAAITLLRIKNKLNQAA